MSELPVIRKIIDDETWLEGERRCCPVSQDDPVVVANVCSVIMRIGQKLREEVTEKLSARTLYLHRDAA